MRKNTLTTVAVALPALIAAAVALSTAPDASARPADPNENASCIAHLIELGTAGSFRSEVHGPLGVPFGREVISHFAVVHEGESAEECLTEQN